jgi:hypothetical protein
MLSRPTWHEDEKQYAVLLVVLAEDDAEVSLPPSFPEHL